MSQIFNITHDDGTLDEYDSLVNPTDLSAETTAALAGTAYGLQVTIDSTDPTYGQKDFTQITDVNYRFRFYINPHTLTMASGDHFHALIVRGSGGGRAFLDFRYDGANYDIRFRMYDDNAVLQDTNYYDITDAEHYIEVHVTYATSAEANDGQATLYIDGVQQQQLTSLDIYNIARPDGIRIGAASGLDSGTSGSLYVDEIVFRNDAVEIGPVTLAGFATIF